MRTFRFNQQTGYTGQTGNALQQSPTPNIYEAAGMASDVLSSHVNKLRNAERVSEITRIENNFDEMSDSILHEYAVKKTIDHETAKSRWDEQFRELDSNIKDPQIRLRIGEKLNGAKKKFDNLLDKQEWQFTVERGIADTDKFLSNKAGKFILEPDNKKSLQILAEAHQRFNESVDAGFIDKDKAEEIWDKYRQAAFEQKFEQDLVNDPGRAKQLYDEGFYDIKPENRDKVEIKLKMALDKQENELISSYVEQMKAGKTDFKSYPGINDTTTILALNNMQKTQKEYNENKIKQDREKDFKLEIFNLKNKGVDRDILSKKIVSAVQAGIVTTGYGDQEIARLESEEEREQSKVARLAQSNLQLGKDVDIDSLNIPEVDKNILKSNRESIIEKDKKDFAQNLSNIILNGGNVNLGDYREKLGDQIIPLQTLQKAQTEGEITEQNRESFNNIIARMDNGQRYTKEELYEAFSKDKVGETLRLTAINKQESLDKQYNSVKNQNTRIEFQSEYYKKLTNGTATIEWFENKTRNSIDDGWLTLDQRMSYRNNINTDEVRTGKSIYDNTASIIAINEWTGGESGINLLPISETQKNKLIKLYRNTSGYFEKAENKKKANAALNAYFDEYNKGGMTKKRSDELLDSYKDFLSATKIQYLREDFDSDIAGEKRSKYKEVGSKIILGEWKGGEQAVDDLRNVSETDKNKLRALIRKTDERFDTAENKEKKNTFLKEYFKKLNTGKMTKSESDTMLNSASDYIPPFTIQHLRERFDNQTIKISTKELSMMEKISQGIALNKSETDIYLDREYGMSENESLIMHISKNDGFNPANQQETINSLKKITTDAKYLPTKIQDLFKHLSRDPKIGKQLAPFAGDLYNSLNSDVNIREMMQQDMNRDNMASYQVLEKFNEQRSIKQIDEAWADAVELVFPTDQKIIETREKTFDKEFVSGFIGNIRRNIPLVRLHDEFFNQLKLYPTTEMKEDEYDIAKDSYKLNPDMDIAMQKSMQYLYANYKKCWITDKFMKNAPELYFKGNDEGLNTFYKILGEKTGNVLLTQGFHPRLFDPIPKKISPTALYVDTDTSKNMTLHVIPGTENQKLPDYAVHIENDGFIEHITTINGTETLLEIKDRLLK